MGNAWGVALSGGRPDLLCPGRGWVGIGNALGAALSGGQIGCVGLRGAHWQRVKSRAAAYGADVGLAQPDHPHR